MDFKMKLCNWMLMVLILGCLNGGLMVEGLSCPTCMYVKGLETPCPLMSCVTEEDYHKSAAAILMDFARIRAKEVLDDPSRGFLMLRQADGSREIAAGSKSRFDKAGGGGAKGPYFCLKVEGPAAFDSGRAVEEKEAVVASGCLKQEKNVQYQPKEEAYILGATPVASVTEGFSFGGELHVCDEKTGSGPNCGEKSTVGGGSAFEPEQDAEFKPELYLYCNACLYLKGSSKPSCKPMRCTRKKISTNPPE